MTSEDARLIAQSVLHECMERAGDAEQFSTNIALFLSHFCNDIGHPPEVIKLLEKIITKLKDQVQ